MFEDLKGQKEIQVIVFQLGEEEYAVPIMSVKEIIMVQNPTKIPKSPPFVEGIINLRGHIIPVIDGRKKFQLELRDNLHSQEARIIVLNLKNQTVGLIVDKVSEVIHLQTDNIERPPVDTNDDNEFITGIGKFKSKLIIIVEPEKLLSSHETESMRGFKGIAETISKMKEEIA